MAIPWTDFDAPGPEGEDPGLNLEGAAPTDGDEWLFNISQITTDSSNLLPVWNWHDDPDPERLEFFASNPHGVITFVAASTPHCWEMLTPTAFWTFLTSSHSLTS